MLEIDVRTDSCGLEKFGDRIYDHAAGISLELTRLVSKPTPFSQPMLLPPPTLIHSRLTPETVARLKKLVVLTDELALARESVQATVLLCRLATQ